MILAIFHLAWWVLRHGTSESRPLQFSGQVIEPTRTRFAENVSLYDLNEFFSHVTIVDDITGIVTVVIKNFDLALDSNSRTRGGPHSSRRETRVLTLRPSENTFHRFQ